MTKWEWTVALLALGVLAVGSAAQHRVPPKFAGRVEAREQVAPKVRRAIEDGLDWLARHQHADGRWDSDGFVANDPPGDRCTGLGNPTYDVGLTGLALLAFLAEGGDPSAGRHAETVARGVAWLMAQTGNEDLQREFGENWIQSAPIGRGPGLIGGDGSHEFIYGHTIATLALLEAFALTGDARVRDTASHGVTYLERFRGAGSGWRYQPADNDSDTSVTGWVAIVLATARDLELAVSPESFTVVARWLDKTTDRASGRTGYVDRGGRSARRNVDHAARFPREKSEVCTAIAMFTSFCVGESLETSPLLTTQAALLAERSPDWDDAGGAIDLYYWYYATSAMRQVGGKTWSAWQKALHKALLGSQVDRGAAAGSWDPIGVWGEVAGRLYSTSLAVLALQTEYRYPEFALLTPLPDGAKFRAARVAWAKAQFGRVQALLAAIDPAELSEPERGGFEAAKEVVAAKVEAASKRLDLLVEERDYLVADEAMESIEARFDGLGPAVRAAALRQNFRKDRGIQREIKASKQLRKVLEKHAVSDPDQHKKLRKELQVIVDKFSGTLAAQRAAATMNSLEE